MKPRQEPPAPMLTLAAEQGGVLTLEQARSFGFGRHCIARLVAQHHWTRVAQGIVWTQRQVADEPLPWLTRAWGGLLAAGDGSRLGPASSGYLHGLVDDEPALPDVFTRDRRSSARTDGPWVLRREQAGVRLGRSVGTPPRLTAATAVIDLCDAAEADEVTGLLTRGGPASAGVRRADPRRAGAACSSPSSPTDPRHPR